MQQDNRAGSGGVRARSSIDWRLESWRTPAVILICGCLISMVGFGPRATLGFFLTPMSTANGWGREVFALSVAIQTLLYGAAQPFSGAIADRFGTVRVIIAGTLLYAAGIFMMAHASTPETLFLSSGVLIGFGLSGCSFNLVSRRSESCCRKAGVRSPSVPARRRARSASSCSLRSPWA